MTASYKGDKQLICKHMHPTNTDTNDTADLVLYSIPCMQDVQNFGTVCKVCVLLCGHYRFTCYVSVVSLSVVTKYKHNEISDNIKLIDVLPFFVCQYNTANIPQHTANCYHSDTQIYLPMLTRGMCSTSNMKLNAIVRFSIFWALMRGRL